MAPKKSKVSKKDEFDENELPDKSVKAPSGKKKSKSKRVEEEDLSDDNAIGESEEVSQSKSKKEKKKSKTKEDGDKSKNLQTVGQAVIKKTTGPRKKGKDQGWNSDEEPDIDILNKKASDSEDEDVLLHAKPKSKKIKKKVIQSDDSGADSLSSADSDIETLSSKVANVKISKSNRQLDDDTTAPAECDVNRSTLPKSIEKSDFKPEAMEDNPEEDTTEPNVEKAVDAKEVETDNQKKMTHKEKKKLKKENTANYPDHPYH